MADYDRDLNYTMLDCPFCDAAGPHFAGEGGEYGCVTCNMWFGPASRPGDRSQLGPNWLPGGGR